MKRLDITSKNQCSSCGGTGISGFKLMDDEAVRCKLCSGTGIISTQDN